MKSISSIKGNLHTLIDKLEDEDLLEMTFQILDSKSKKGEGKLLNRLSGQQKKDLYESYEESFDDKNLIELEQLKDKHSKWFER